MSKYTLSLNRIAKGDVASAGGKGASLGEMTQSKLPIPKGFVVLTSAFDAFLAQNNVDTRIQKILAKLRQGETEKFRNASQKIQSLISETTIPPAITKAIVSEYKKLCCTRVAVRSSATVEDGATAAWAGQLESYLNTSAQNLLGNIKQCWSSLFSVRALFYLHETHKPTRRTAVAVVVQEMVQAESSGVAFSTNPVTGNRNCIVIEAGYGLGEAIVSGEITPDFYLVAKDTLSILDKTVQKQNKSLQAATSGNKWTLLSEKRSKRQKLANNEILQLAALVMRVEHNWNQPVDVEWARKNGKFYIIQSRPITNHHSRSLLPTMAIANKDDYIKTFSAWGLSVLFTDICRDMYSQLDVLYTNVDGKFDQYFRVSKYNITQDDGVNFYRSYKRVREYIHKLLKLQEKFSSFHERKIKQSETLSESVVKVFFGFCVSICRAYSLMNVEYTDKAFLMKDIEPNIKANMEKIAVQKNIIREYLDEIFFTKNVYVDLVIKTLSRQYRIRKSELESYTQQEVFSLFRGVKTTKDLTNQRRDAFAVISLEGEARYYSGQQARNIAEALRERTGVCAEIFGQVAKPGPTIIGRVKVISVDYSKFKANIVRDMNRMPIGSILVAETTAPELIIACKKAAVIITDMGGMLSHAAIVSRELGIPCIVGTRNATGLLKDGDVVEVDATTGRISLLKN